MNHLDLGRILELEVTGISPRGRAKKRCRCETGWSLGDRCTGQSQMKEANQPSNQKNMGKLDVKRRMMMMIIDKFR